MAVPATNLAVRQEGRSTPASAARRMPSLWQPFESLRGEIEQIFDEFTRGFGLPSMSQSLPSLEPSRRAQTSLSMTTPAMDVVEKEKEYQITAELPGLDEKDIEVNVANGGLTIRGEKKVEKEEKQKDYYVSERRYGSFERYFGLPEGVDPDKIEASFKNGVLKVTLPKTAEAQKPAKKIEVKAA